jgi:hypothetical protein
LIPVRGIVEVMGQAKILDLAEEPAWQVARNAAPKSVIANLSRIPGVGPSIAADLFLLGIRDVAELRGRNPEALYAEMCDKAGQQDRCLLYVFRCAVYYASTAAPEPEMLKWWNWKDGAAARGRGKPARV